MDVPRGSIALMWERGVHKGTSQFVAEHQSRALLWAGMGYLLVVVPVFIADRVCGQVSSGMDRIQCKKSEALLVELQVWLRLR